MEDNAQLTSHITESLSGIQTIKENNIETDFENTTNNKLKKCLQSVFKLGTVSNIQNALVISIELIGEIVILWCGGLEVISGRMTLGQLISFNALLGYFLSPVKNLINLQPQMQGAIVAAERLGEIFDIEIEKKIDNYKKNVVSLCGDIQIKNITFRYGTRKPIFNDFSLEIKSGEKIAFVGESGSGKTTLAKLLIGLYPLSGGSICIAENCINEIPIDFLRKKISYISQEAFWFSGSIRENLVLGLPNITDNQIIDAIKKVQAFEFINDFPLKLDTKLEENGYNLSAGQRQRLSIARAILKNPDLLIMDEATSNLDFVTEKAIEDTIEKCFPNITIIIIAHRLSIIRKCDRICYFEKGKVIEMGNHEELMKNNGQYAELCKCGFIEM